jgi:hypothetical protein
MRLLKMKQGTITCMIFKAKVVLTFCHVISYILPQDIVSTRRYGKQKAQTM